MSQPSPPSSPGTRGGPLSRRSLLGASAGAALAGVAGGYAVARLDPEGPFSRSAPTAARATPKAGRLSPDEPVPFHGPHQAGIETPAQDRVHFVALDVVTKDRAVLVDLLDRWTQAAERMAAGVETVLGGVAGVGPKAVPQDTGEAYGLPASNLTLTMGFGPSMFDDRFGLAAQRPPALRELPPFTGDRLDPARCGGDIGIQACATDPQVAVHAVRNLVRMGAGVVRVRWSQLGFGRTSSTSTEQATPRNLFGFKDGTNNLKLEDPALFDEHVWVGAPDVPDSASWMVGGSYLVARRIRMLLEIWDVASLQDQEETFGRNKLTGAALGQVREFDKVNFEARAPSGHPAVPADSHIALASAHHLDGVRILRRGYTFTDGADGAGHLDAGLFFLAFMRDPGAQFVPMQRALAAKDKLNEYITHTGSAVFACPPGVEPGGRWGGSLFPEVTVRHTFVPPPPALS